MVAFFVSNHTFKATIDDKKWTTNRTTLGLLYFSPDIFLTISNFQPKNLNLNPKQRGVGSIYNKYANSKIIFWGLM